MLGFPWCELQPRRARRAGVSITTSLQLLLQCHIIYMSLVESLVDKLLLALRAAPAALTHAWPRRCSCGLAD